MSQRQDGLLHVCGEAEGAGGGGDEEARQVLSRFCHKRGNQFCILSFPRTVGRRRGDAIENRQRPEKGRKAGKVKREVEKVKELNQKYFLLKVLKERRVLDESGCPIVTQEYIQRKYNSKK